MSLHQYAAKTQRRTSDTLQSWFVIAVLRAQRIWHARRARAAMTKLLTYDDRMLNDIGLTRSDVEGALTRPWHEDPSAALAKHHCRRIAARPRMRR